MKLAINVLAATALAALLACSAGCDSTGGGSDKSAISITYSRAAEIELPADVRKLAIAEFTGQAGQDSRWGEITSDKLSSALDDYNRKYQRYQLVDRKHLKDILGEQDIQLAVSETGDATKIGKIAKVDAMIYGSAKISPEHVRATKNVPSFDGGRPGMKTVSYQKLKVTAVISFTMDDINTGKTIVSQTITKNFDSDRDSKQKGFAGVMKSMSGSNDQVPVAEAANVLIDECVQQFVRMISPHEVTIKERLAKSRSKDKAVLKLVAQGNRLAVSGDYSEALQCYQDALEQESDDDAALFDAGLMCEATEKYKEASEFYSKAIKANPEQDAYIRARSRVSSGSAKVVKPQDQDSN
jgi:tetratricopeptide (TPR) repeat protein